MLRWNQRKAILTYDMTAITEEITKHRLDGHEQTIQDLFEGNFASFAGRADFTFIFISPAGKAAGSMRARHLHQVPASAAIGSRLVVADSFQLQSDAEMPAELATPFRVYTA